MLEWNDGLSLGVKAIDEDHKKLLEIINRLSKAIDENATEDVLEGIFSDLNEYVSLHFAREELYMQQNKYQDIEEHKKQHDSFAAKVPEIKEKFFHAKDYAGAQEIAAFLTDWLVNHIINEDMQIIETLKNRNCKQMQEGKRSFLKCVISKTTDILSFNKRIFLSVFIPLSGMFILSYFILYGYYNNYTNIKDTSRLSSIIYDISELTHSLQAERGLSSGHLSSEHSKFELSLQEQRKDVDKNIKAFAGKIQTINPDKLASIHTCIHRFHSEIISLDDFRSRIDKREISQSEMIVYYRGIVENIIDITSKIEIFNLNKKISATLDTLSNILHYKEQIGLKRAYGTILIEKKDTANEDFIAFIQLLNAKEILLHKLEHTSSKKYIEIYKEIQKSNPEKTVVSYEEKMKNRDMQDLDSKAWFLAISQYINKIYSFEKELIQELETTIQDEINRTVDDFIVLMLYLSGIAFITLALLYIFRASTQKQIDELTNAMIDLSKGGRNFRLIKLRTKDDIAKIHDAYELTRLKLLKGDIYRQLYLNKKEIEIKNHERENAKLETAAFLDYLTKTTNRRKFEQLAKTELARSSRYKTDLSFLLLDLDYFKNINDTYGHAAGDDVLKHFANICKDAIRNIDTVARIGGEEFVIMLAQTNEENALLFAGRLLEKINNSEMKINGDTLKYTASIGISIFDYKNETELKTILDRADKALYEAKKSGRNCIKVYKNL
ncbi:bacteriohemerythrin [bacterium]|nr:bacteriohemerythrin [bacterium]MBU1989777.1 bacteriohemerythrin [bacterium]